MADSRWKGRVAIVTGASAGIGAAICRSLVAIGMKVVGVARRAEVIETAAKELPATEDGSLTAIRCDLTDDDQVEDMFKQVIHKFGSVHLCVNNAGYSCNNSLLDGNTEEWRGMLDVNVVSVCLLTKLVVNSMRKNKIDDGHIINISSMSGHRVVANPGVHFYASTKFALKALTEALRQELRALKSHIRVTGISPGLVETEFAEVMTKDKSRARQIYSSMVPLTTEDIAASVLHAITAPPHVEINDILIRPTEQVN